MGLKHGSATLYSIKNLDIGSVVDACKKLAEVSGKTPVIDVDCSNVCLKYCKNIPALSSFLMKWAETGLCIRPVCDGPVRPISKQATNKRKAEREKCRIKAAVIRKEIRQLRSKLYADPSSREQTVEQINSLQSAYKKAENASNNAVPDDLPRHLRDELEGSCAHSKNNARGYVEDVVVAEWQADAYMIGRAASGESVLMITSDADMPVLGGDNCLALKQFSKDGELELVSTSKATIDRVMECLTEEDRKKATYAPAKYPIFEGINDRKLRAVMCLFLGCDVYEGMKGIGAKSLAEDVIGKGYEAFIRRRPENQEVSLYAYLKKYLYSKVDGLDHDTVQTLIRALICEPTNASPTDTEKAGRKSYRTYVSGVKPTVLPEYLDEFATDETEIKSGPAVKMCIGVDEGGHKFLAADGHSKCHNCQGVLCRYCKEFIGPDTYCLLCYAEKSIVPFPGEQIQSRQKPISEIRNELATKYNFDHVEELTFEELEDFYEVKDVLYSRVNEQADAVPFPLYSSNEMDDQVCYQDLMEIDLADGGSFVADPDLDQKYLPEILEFFGSLVRFESKKRTDHIKDSPIYDSMPEMLIDFAEKSRIDSGFRLLARTVRHSFDSKLSPMSECNTKLIVDENGEVGVYIRSKIPASMKKNIYDTSVVATPSSLLGCKCGCQAGCQGDERIVCVHIYVRLFQLSLLLHDCLADNILCELTARIFDSVEADPSNEEDEQWLWSMNNWTGAEKMSIKTNVILLMEAAGEFVSWDDAKSKSLPELLEVFAVGTQKRKAWKQATKIPPKPSQLGPVAKMLFKSTASLGKIHMRRAKDSKVEPRESSCTHLDALAVNPDHFDDELAEPSSNSDMTDDSDKAPAYRKIWSVLNAVGFDMEDTSLVGLRLLNIRAEHQDTEFTLQQKNIMDRKSKEEWCCLVKQSKERSMNSSSSQINNIKQKHNNSPSTPKSNKRSKTTCAARVVTPSPLTEDRSRLRRNQQRLPTAPKKKPAPKKKRPKFIKCHLPGCPVTNQKDQFSHIGFHQVPCHPKELKSLHPKNSAIANRKAKIFHRREMLRRMLIDPNSDKTYMVCERHQFECKSHFVKVKSSSYTYRLTLPVDIGPKSSQNISDSSAGLGCDRQLQRVLQESRQVIQQGWVVQRENANDDPRKGRTARPTSKTAELRAVEAERDRYKAESRQYRADAASATLALNQTFEQHCPNQHVRMNPIVQSLACLDRHIADPTLATPAAQAGRFFKTERAHSTAKKARRFIARDPPKVDLSISDDEVKRRTGFPGLQTLLAYIIIVCNGDISIVLERNTSLTWFEEWFLHFEYKWGRTLTRLWDIEKAYGPNRRFVRRLIAQKYKVERRARDRWPVYATHEEDIAIRKPKWSDKYPRSQRIVMWDMTNIEAYGFTDTDLNRLTYSKYYNQNCFKGGVFIQLCGWLGTAELWPGAVSDSDYNKREGYLQRQEAFANNDLVEMDGEHKILPFTNVYDKGYRAKAVAWKTGRQHVLQPDWAESDKHFSRIQTLRSASIATDRAGNERGVNVCKRSWFVRRGFTPSMNPILISNAWATWSFQSNFMFSPVL